MIDGVILPIMVGTVGTMDGDGMEFITHIKGGRIGITTSTHLLIGDKIDLMQFTLTEEEVVLILRCKPIEDA
jgi:hypothetical protein